MVLNTLDKLDKKIAALPTGKVAGLDEIFPEFLKHFGTRKWLPAVIGKRFQNV